MIKMGSKELIESLKKSAADRLAAMRDEAEAEALKIQEDADRKIELMRSHYRHLLSAEAEARTAEIKALARANARRLLLNAEKNIERRCFRVAVSCLHVLRDENYTEVFDYLASELPPLE